MTSLRGVKVGVVGATGFIGSHLTERLVHEGADVLCIARTAERWKNLDMISSLIQFVECDVADASRIADVFAAHRPAVVFHLACHPDARESWSQIERSLSVNAQGVVNVLEASHRAGTQTFVLADSVKVYGNYGAPASCSSTVEPLCSYAIAKVAAWQACRLYSSMTGMRVGGIRPTFVYGPRQNWNLVSHVVDSIERGKPIRLQGGRQTRDPLYVTDAIEAFIRAALRPAAHGFSIPIGGGTERSIASMCESICEAVGVQAEIEESAEPPRMTEIWRSYTDNADAIRLLGWRPRVSFKDGLARFLAARSRAAAASKSQAVALAS